MAVTKEYRCMAHGPFDGAEAICPHGCSTVVREFRTAPGGRSAKTKGSDAALEHLARRFGLSDMSNRDGSVGGSRKHADAMKPTWGELPKGNVFVPGKGEVNEKGEALSTVGGAIAGLAGMGIDGKSVAEKLGREKGLTLAPEPTFADITKNLKGPRPLLPGKQYQYGTQADLDKAIGK